MHFKETNIKKKSQTLPTAALHARVSSDRQDVDISVAAQLRVLRDYAKRNGYRLACPAGSWWASPDVARQELGYKCRTNPMAKGLEFFQFGGPYKTELRTFRWEALL